MHGQGGRAGAAFRNSATWASRPHACTAPYQQRTKAYPAAPVVQIHSPGGGGSCGGAGSKGTGCLMLRCGRTATGRAHANVETLRVVFVR